MAGQPGFFDLSDRYEALSAAGDPLERLFGPDDAMTPTGLQDRMHEEDGLIGLRLDDWLF